MNIFITGTDTNIGKTVISSWICRNSGFKYWKPIQTGSDADADRVRAFSPSTEVLPNAIKLREPLSPYDAARLEGTVVDINKVLAMAPKDKTIIEGAGGLLVPLTDTMLTADMIPLLNAKVIVVAQSKLGFLNHLFLTVEALRTRKIEVLGIVLFGECDLVPTVEKFTKTEVLAILPQVSSIFSAKIPEKVLQSL